jgi:pyruvate/2-oxoacid:ferredoxin oxidoreductase beta subunit
MAFNEDINLINKIEETAKKQFGLTFINAYWPDGTAIILNMESSALISEVDINALWLTAINNGFRLVNWYIETGRITLIMKDEINRDPIPSSVKIFKDLSKEEETEFKQWARDNYKPHTNINELWHPIIKAECEKINLESS